MIAKTNKLISILGQSHGLFNLVLLALSVSLLAVYIIWMNHYASHEYKMRQMQGRLSELLEANSQLNSEKFQYDSLPKIAQFAERSGMVEANGVGYIFEAGNVAQR